MSSHNENDPWKWEYQNNEFGHLAKILRSGRCWSWNFAYKCPECTLTGECIFLGKLLRVLYCRPLRTTPIPLQDGVKITANEWDNHITTEKVYPKSCCKILTATKQCCWTCEIEPAILEVCIVFGSRVRNCAAWPNNVQIEIVLFACVKPLAYATLCIITLVPVCKMSQAFRTVPSQCWHYCWRLKCFECPTKR